MDSIHFSVLIPLYNKEKYIRRTIESVLNQTYQKFEIIVVNDGSTDDSLKEIEKIKSEKIRVIHQQNLGVSVARNNGIGQAKHRWIALLDGDDEYKDTFLEEIKTAIQLTPNCIAYVTGFEKVDLKAKLFTPNLRYVPRTQGVLKNYYKSCMLGEQCISSSSICLNQALLKKNSLLELFPSGIKRGEDLDAWTKIALNDQIYFINKPLVRINSVIDNVSNVGFNYSETFDYKGWLKYQPDNLNKRIYLRGLVIKRKLHIAKKLFFSKNIKAFIKYAFNY